MPHDGIVVNLPKLRAKGDDVLEGQACPQCVVNKKAVHLNRESRQSPTPFLPNLLSTQVGVVGESKGIVSGTGVGTCSLEDIELKERFGGPRRHYVDA